MNPKILVALAFVFFGCASSEVKRLSLRDPSLPIEARRWLADAEDEVAITQARVDDARMSLEKLDVYCKSLLSRLEDTWSKERGAAQGEAKQAVSFFVKYANNRVLLSELELVAAKKAHDLAATRLTQARAETAVRYDVAVYELDPIVQQVEMLRKEVADAERKVEEQRVNADKLAEEVWGAYSQYAIKGGVTNSLWKAD